MQALLVHASSPLASLLFQILVVLITCRILGCTFKRLGQTEVIGEIFAGLLLGKSFLGWLWPEGFGFLFPEASMPRLYFLSQIGLIFFMFVVGLELDLGSLKKRALAAVMISHGSIVLPFALGAAISLALFPRYGAPGTDSVHFALFMGIAMSITAFPVLARILKERKLTDTPLGTMALTCAAVDDVTAWCLLAAIVGIAKAGSASAALPILALTIVLVGFMLQLVRPMLTKVFAPALEGTVSRPQFAGVFLVVLASSLAAEVIGIHALFGAFLAGICMPKSKAFRTELTRRVEDVSAVALLPLFFAFTGIRTQVGLLTTVSDWAFCVAIILLAVLGKMGGSIWGARMAGMPWRESLSIGALMNTRGLVELVVLNIGYDLGILPPAVFSMMVVMALVTTMMTAPLLTWFSRYGFQPGGRVPKGIITGTELSRDH